ncbi:hypothetical protein FOCC_FOCC006343 [Frankliniella occidentalis]|nr:hypothetical protein FOCC_FOCC006343 [Frankliniella occidentalis]
MASCATLSVVYPTHSTTLNWLNRDSTKEHPEQHPNMLFLSITHPQKPGEHGISIRYKSSTPTSSVFGKGSNDFAKRKQGSINTDPFLKVRMCSSEEIPFQELIVYRSIDEEPLLNLPLVCHH